MTTKSPQHRTGSDGEAGPRGQVPPHGSPGGPATSEVFGFRIIPCDAMPTDVVYVTTERETVAVNLVGEAVDRPSWAGRRVPRA